MGVDRVTAVGGGDVEGQTRRAVDLLRAERAARACDLLLAVGSTLTVSPACDLVGVAASAGARVVIVNDQPTPYDHVADAVVREPISEALPALVGAGRA